MPNDYIAKAESVGTPFVGFNFHTPTFTRLVLQQINQLNYLTANVPHPSVEEATQSQPQSNGESSVATAKKAFSSKSLAYGYGTNHSGNGKTLVIDFSSPNIAKPFHAGHLRSTIIGMTLANVYTANGWKVVKLNYLGDWGKQFGLLAVGFEKYGDEEKIKSDPIRHLFDVYVKINEDGRQEIKEWVANDRKEKFAKAKETGEKLMILNDKQEMVELTEDLPYTRGEEDAGDANSPTHSAARATFKKMEEGDEQHVAIWKRFRDMSILKYEEIYERLNIEFDIYWGESCVDDAYIDREVDKLVEMGVAKMDGNTLLVDLQKYKLGKTPIRKRDGTKLYMTRDIGGAVQRKDMYSADKLIYVVAAQQDLHFSQLFKTMDLMGYPWAKDMLHVKWVEWTSERAIADYTASFGMVLGMSTRKGTVVFLEDILNEAKDVMHEQMKSNEDKYASIEDPEGTSDLIGITAVKIQDMQGKRGNNYEFNLKRMTSFEGDTGPYLQYAHVRLASVERKAAAEIVLPPPSERAQAINTDLLVEPKAREIIYQLSLYPDILKKAMETHEPSNIVTYLFKLCHLVSSAWETLIVRGQPKDLALARLWLFVSTRDVLGNAMRILSLTPLERM